MKKEFIEAWIKTRVLRNRQKDPERIKSMIFSAEINTKVTKTIAINDDSATLIFREMYESIRQIGDAKWWLLGYEPENHLISLESLKDFDIKEKIKLNYLERFKNIRNDINYRGFRVTISQAQEIIDFWNLCGEEMVKIIKKEI